MPSGVHMIVLSVMVYIGSSSCPNGRHPELSPCLLVFFFHVTTVNYFVTSMLRSGESLKSLEIFARESYVFEPAHNKPKISIL